VLGRGEKEVKIGDLSGYWLRIRLKDGRAGYAFGEFFNLDTFFSYDVPVFHGSAADPPARAELFGNGALFRAKRSRGAYGADAAVSGDEEIEFLADGSVRFSSSSSTLDGLSVTRYGGSWSSQSGWVMLRLEKGAEILKHGGSETGREQSMLSGMEIGQ
jgi:hypothetical protein